MGHVGHWSDLIWASRKHGKAHVNRPPCIQGFRYRRRCWNFVMAFSCEERHAVGWPGLRGVTEFQWHVKHFWYNARVQIIWRTDRYTDRRSKESILRRRLLCRSRNNVTHSDVLGLTVNTGAYGYLLRRYRSGTDPWFNKGGRLWRERGMSRGGAAARSWGKVPGGGWGRQSSLKLKAFCTLLCTRSYKRQAE